MLEEFDWRLRSACRSAEPALFEPSAEDEWFRGYPPRAFLAAAYCRECPVLAQCGAWADARKEQGVWGGTWRMFATRTGYVSRPIPAREARPKAPKKGRTRERAAT